MLTYTEIVDPTDERVEKILQAGEKNFERLGFRKASIDEICEDAGISKPTFYKHFDSKQTLFFAVRIYVDRELFTKFEEGSRNLATASDKLKLFFKLTEEFRRTSRLHDEELDTNRELRNGWKTHPLFCESYLHQVDLIERVILEGIASDEFRAADPRAVAHAVVTNTVLLPRLRRASRARPDSSPSPIHEFVANLLLSGIKK